MDADNISGEAFSAERVFSADCGSLKSSAEAVLAPIIWACVERFRNMFARNVTMSYAMNAVHARSKAAPLTNMFIHVSLREIVWSWRIRILINSQPGRLFAHWSLLSVIRNLRSTWQFQPSLS